MIVNIAFYYGTLDPAKVLLLSCQNGEIVTITTTRAIKQTKSKLQKLNDKHVIEFFFIKSLMRCDGEEASRITPY